VIETTKTVARRAAAATLFLLLCCAPARAQVTPAAGYTPPDDTPKVNVGVTIYTNYTYTGTPTITDSDGDVVHASAFDVTRAYVNVTGQVSHLVSYRVTPDISGHFGNTVTGGAAGERVTNNYDGSLVFRLKYAFGQLSLDDWAPHGTWVRLGVQQTPLIDYMEGIYRYRFQGTVFIEREGFLSSSDFGVSSRLAFPKNYGDVHVGYYNGDTYTKAEVNDQKAIQARVSFRPLPQHALLRGLRLTAFTDQDHYVKGADRKRNVLSLTFEHKYVNLGLDSMTAKDQTSTRLNLVDASGWSFWATPRTTKGLEGLFRYDSLKPDKTVDARRNRTIAGVSYWFKTEKAAALLANVEHVSNDKALNRANETRYALHALFAF
jgi:hypothetical protein